MLQSVLVQRLRAFRVLECSQNWPRIRCHYDSTRPTTKMCIVGSGPAGFYAAQYLLKHLPEIRIDMIERLPVPFGLVR